MLKIKIDRYNYSFWLVRILTDLAAGSSATISDVHLADLLKGELHIHLSGATPPTKIQELFERFSIPFPADGNIKNDLYVPSGCASLSEYLKPWGYLRLIPINQECLNEMVDSTFSTLAAANVSFVEIRHTAVHLPLLCQISLSEALSWLLEALEKSSKKYRIRAGLVLTVSRGSSAITHLRQLLEAYLDLGMPRQVVGLDLAGHEDIESPLGLSREFRNAKDRYGLGITIHAGETGRPERVWDALAAFDADRIGHGVASALDPTLLETLHKRDICLELCLVSNTFTKAEEKFPGSTLTSLLAFGVPFVLCSDNPGIQNTSINDDYQLFLEKTNRSDILLGMYEKQKKYSFLKLTDETDISI